jgi:zinc transport system ATP-binding protein
MQKGFYDLLTQLNKSMAIMMVSHDIASVAYYVKKIACLNKRLYYHGSEELTTHDLEETYQCPIELIAHGVPHRVLKDHQI